MLKRCLIKKSHLYLINISLFLKEKINKGIANLNVNKKYMYT